jgi:hypothetical protein
VSVINGILPMYVIDSLRLAHHSCLSKSP